MEYQFIDLDFTDEEYEIIAAFCRIYHLALEDGLLAVLIILGKPVGLNRRALKVRWTPVSVMLCIYCFSPYLDYVNMYHDN